MSILFNTLKNTGMTYLAENNWALMNTVICQLVNIPNFVFQLFQICSNSSVYGMLVGIHGFSKCNSIITVTCSCSIVHIYLGMHLPQSIQDRDWYHPFVSERWNAAKMLSTSLHQCRWPVHQRRCMCYHVCVIMHVKDPQLSVVRVGHCVL